MININEMEIYDGVKYTYYNAENEEHETLYGTVYGIGDGSILLNGEFCDEIVIDENNSYFCERVEEPTEEEHETIKHIMDVYWDRVNDGDEELCVGDLIAEMYDEEKAEILTEKWATFYGYEPIL